VFFTLRNLLSDKYQIHTVIVDYLRNVLIDLLNFVKILLY